MLIRTWVSFNKNKIRYWYILGYGFYILLSIYR
nr:MAG TPA: hypothetical protein [Caudoviricetes sp.]